MAEWDAAQYLKFKKERTQPAIDLAARIEMDAPGAVVDIGCGPGNSTAVLAGRFPGARILGVDNSPQMISAAAQANPALRFELADVSHELPQYAGRFDVVFSNACIQWVPDHPALLPRLLGMLRDGGTLAVQLPMNFDEPIHQSIAQIVASPEWRGRFKHPRVFYTLLPDEYHDLLAAAASDFTMWQTTYFHRMPSHQSIIEWYRGTGMRPYLAELDDAGKAAFEAEVLERLKQHYPIRRNGEIILRFPRLFFTATK